MIRLTRAEFQANPGVMASGAPIEIIRPDGTVAMQVCTPKGSACEVCAEEIAGLKERAARDEQEAARAWGLYRAEKALRREAQASLREVDRLLSPGKGWLGSLHTRVEEDVLPLVRKALTKEEA